MYFRFVDDVSFSRNGPYGRNDARRERAQNDSVTVRQHALNTTAYILQPIYQGPHRTGEGRSLLPMIALLLKLQ